MYACSFLFSYKSLAGGGPSSIELGSFQAQRLARNVISPVVVRTFSVGAPSVQLALGGGGAGPPLSPFSCNSNLGKIRANTMAVGQFDGRPNGDVQRRHQVDCDVPGGSLQYRIRALRSGDELGHNTASSGLRPGRGHAVQRNAATAGLSSHRSRRGTETDAAAAGFNFCRARNLA